jgi:hypothetical protein
MDDKDKDVRLIAFDCLYNMSRNLEELILINFKDIFESMLLRAADNDDRINYICYINNRCKESIIHS